MQSTLSDQRYNPDIDSECCAHSSQGKFTYLLGKQQTTNQQSGNEIALWVKPCAILQDGGEAIVLINFLNLSLSPLSRKVILI